MKFVKFIWELLCGMMQIAIAVAFCGAAYYVFYSFTYEGRLNACIDTVEPYYQTMSARDQAVAYCFREVKP